MADVELICWDFGNTLADERWLRHPHPDVPDWEDVFDREMGKNERLDEDWNLGLASVEDLAGHLASAFDDLDETAIIQHLEEASRRVVFFPEARASLEAAKGRVMQAIVTVNPDIFTNVVVPSFNLNEFVDATVASWQMGSRSKVVLAQEARRALGFDPVDLSRTLLIDNKEANIEEFANAGGQVYLFTGDQDFAKDRSLGILPPALWLAAP